MTYLLLRLRSVPACCVPYLRTAQTWGTECRISSRPVRGTAPPSAQRI